MKVNRRTFFTLAGMAGAVAALPHSAEAISLPDPAAPAKLRLSCQEGVAPGKTVAEKLDFLEGLGFEGFEPGGGGLAGRVEELQKALQGRKIKISAICAGFQGVPISEKEAERKKAIDTSKEILTAAGALGSTGMILVPAFNGQTTLGNKEARELLVTKILPELGDHAAQAGTRLLLEPLNRGECFFLRQLADAASICRDVNNPGIAQMGDFWHMTIEETNDMGAFISAGKYLHHVHIASRKTRNMPGEDEGDNYTVGFRGLKAIGYQDFVSFECGCKGKDRKQILTDAVKLIKENWAAA
jgi:sugar phosphate isomerase/epimerase